SLARQPAADYRPVAFLDDDLAKRRLRIHGIPVLGDRSRIAEVAGQTGATVLVIAIARASGTAIRDLTREAENCGLIPKVIPSVSELLSGGARIDGVRDSRISDLLGRRPVTTDMDAVAGHFAGRGVPGIRAPGRVRQVFEERRPEIVFHAAALKHLPLLERYPAEALKSNVWGTLAVL